MSRSQRCASLAFKPAGNAAGVGNVHIDEVGEGLFGAVSRWSAGDQAGDGEGRAAVGQCGSAEQQVAGAPPPPAALPLSLPHSSPRCPPRAQPGRTESTAYPLLGKDPRSAPPWSWKPTGLNRKGGVPASARRRRQQDIHPPHQSEGAHPAPPRRLPSTSLGGKGQAHPQLPQPAAHLQLGRGLHPAPP